MWPWPMKLKIAYPVSDTTSVHCRSRYSIVVLSVISFLLLLFLSIVYFLLVLLYDGMLFVNSLWIFWQPTSTSKWCIMVPLVWSSIILRIGRIQSETGCILLMPISKLTYVNLFWNWYSAEFKPTREKTTMKPFQ